MTVIAPSDVQYNRHDVEAFPAGNAGAGMHLEIVALPRKVNFGWISFLEVATDLNHHPNPDFTRFRFDNTIHFDEAAASGPPVTPPPPWAAGGFFWSIPDRYRASNSTGTGRLFTTSVQTFAIDAAGAITITKRGQSSRVATVNRHP
jgi:hypothetical protein